MFTMNATRFVTFSIILLDLNMCHYFLNVICQARVQGGGGPLEFEKQKKKKKKVIRANIKLFHLYFATFSIENVFFSASF